MRRSSVDDSSVQLRADSREAARSASSPDSQRPGSINFSYPMNARPNSPRAASPTETSPTDNTSLQGPGQASSPVQSTKRESPIGRVQDTNGRRINTVAGDVGSQTTSGSRSSSNNSYERPGSNVPQTYTSSDSSHGKRGTRDGQASRAPFEPFDLRIPKRRPSTVREDREGEEQKSQHDEPSQRLRGTAGTIRKPANVENGQSTVWLQPPESTTSNPKEIHTKKATGTSDPPFSEQESSGSTRAPMRSLSQSRATRFSEHLQIIAQDEPLHSPPPRSMSPVKPALKRSASQSRSPDRTLVLTNVAEAANEESDNTSVASEEAPQTGATKKTAKVCFEDETDGMKNNTPIASPSSSAPSSPRGNVIPKPLRPPVTWGNAREDNDADRMDHVMKPRPTLPSFGSVRGRGRLVEEPERAHTWQGTSSTSRTPVQLIFSNDHAIGGLLNDNTAKMSPPVTQPPSNFPLPPEVTSVEGNGYEYSSDESWDSSDSDDGADPRDFSPPGDQLHTHPKQTTDASEKREEPHNKQSLLKDVPFLSVHSATPKPEEPNLAPGSETTENVSSAHSTANVNADYSDSDSGESIYSDAAEDLSDLDGDGFGFINAIVDSPVSKLPTFEHASSRTSRPDSPAALRLDTLKADNAQTNISSSIASWSPSSPSDAPKEAPQSAERPSGSPSQATPPRPVDGFKKPHENNRSTQTQATLFQEQPPRQKPAPQNTVHMQGTEDTKRNLMQSDQRTAVSPKPSQTDRKEVPTSPSGSVARDWRAKAPVKRDAQRTEFRTDEPLQRTLSNGSDSSSSFKRIRRSPPSTGRYTMRRTLRSPGGHAAPPSDFPVPRGNQKSPSSSDGKQTVLRTTLRGSPNGTTTKTSPYGSPGKPNRVATFSGRNIFNTSSPKAEPRRAYLDDSSDDEDDFTPVRGIPRRVGAIDGDSTELEDSSDSDSRRNTRRRRFSNARRVTQKAPVVPSEEKTREISDRNMDYYLPQNRNQRTGLLNRLSLSKRGRRSDASRVGKLELESAARRDTPLERSRLELERARLTTPSPISRTSNPDKSPTTPPSKWHSMSPKLQKRMSNRVGSGSWFTRSSNNGMPPSIPEANEHGITTNGNEPDRPHTSDGIVENGKPPATATGVNGDSPQARGVDVDGRRSPLSEGGASPRGKKRRFPLLRKALGLRK